MIKTKQELNFLASDRIMNRGVSQRSLKSVLFELIFPDYTILTDQPLRQEYPITCYKGSS